MKKKINCLITIDFEEWYHIEYLKKYNFPKSHISYCVNISDFINKINDKSVKTTLFVVGDVVETNKIFLKETIARGNSIGCHTASHECLKDFSENAFLANVKKNVEIIKNNVGIQPRVFRAPSFSANLNLVEKLSALGFVGDSSYINSTANEFYAKNDLSGWKKIENGIFLSPNEKMVEIEIPTIRFLGKNIPIGGGGFFRLYPFFIYKYFLKKYLKNHNTMMLFIHPYEIVGTKFPFDNQLSLKDRIRLNLGRKNVSHKFLKLIDYLMKSYDCNFSTVDEFSNNIIKKIGEGNRL